jgi:DNA repair exonuclease SbcCD ATPase subunit
MNIKILKLIVKNFKGIKDLTIDFSLVTNIFGENATGKTTIQDAFSFLLFDKDSKDSSKFDVQPLDKNNNPIHNLETVIEAMLNVDGKELTLKRVYKEKYAKVRGTSKIDFKGCESEYYVNEVPHKVTEYKKYINELLNENIFKLVTNPMYFSSLPWKNRREIITEIIGDLDNIVVLDFKKELEPLRKHLTEHTVNELMKIVKSKVNKLKEDRGKLPVRIDEANKSIQQFEFEALEVQKKAVMAEIKEIDEKLQDKSKANEGLYDLKCKLMEKQSKLAELEYNFKAIANKSTEEIEKNIRAIESDIRHLKIIIEEFQGSIDDKKSRNNNMLQPKKADLLKDYKDIKELSFQFDEDSCTCPTCKRKFESEDIEAKRAELEGNFNSDKAKKLEKNIKEGKTTAAEIEKNNTEVQELDGKIKEQNTAVLAKENSLKMLQEKLSIFKAEKVEEPIDIKNILNEIEDLKSKIENFKAEDTKELKCKKNELQQHMQEIEKQLAFKETNQKTLKRIEELEAEELKVSEKIAELEGLEMLSEEFIRAKVELLEEKVNSKFKYVSFKMFRNQINGGLEECCEPCVEGVPFTSNLNTAAKINAGLDIINTLCDHYKVKAPIFVDNRESVNNIIEVDSQLINLIVSKDKKLKVEVM